MNITFKRLIGPLTCFLLMAGVASAQNAESFDAIIKQAAADTRRSAPEGLATYERALAAASTDEQRALALLAMGSVNQNTVKDYAKARACFDRVLALPQITPANRVAAQRRIGSSFATEAKHEQAVEAYRKTIELLADDVDQRTEVQYQMGQSLSSLRKIDETRAVAQQIIDTPGADAGALGWAQNVQGNKLRNEQQLDQARAMYQKTLSLEKAGASNQASAQLGIAETYFAEKKFDQALLEFEKTATLPLVPASQRIAGIVRAGETLAELQQFEQAYNRLLAAINDPAIVASTKVSTTFALARLYGRQKKLDEARATYATISSIPGATDKQKESAVNESAKLGK